MVEPSPAQTITPGTRFWLLLTGGGIFLLGLTVLLSWHFHQITLIQVMPGSPPMRYNTALMFLLSGMTLLVMVQGQRILAGSLGLAVMLMGGLTLAQYVFEVDLGIDQWFIQDYLTNLLDATENAGNATPIAPRQLLFIKVDRFMPGRPSPNTALGFVMVGIALLGLTWAQIYPRVWARQLADAIAGTSAFGVLGIGLIALLGYLTDLGTAYSWRYLTGMSIPTDIGLLWLGGSLLIGVLNSRSLTQFPSWVPFSVGFGVFTANLFLWQALVSWHHNVMEQFSEFATASNAILSPVSSIVLLEGILLALLVVLVTRFTLLLLKQKVKLEQSNQALSRSNSLLQATLEATADGIVVLDQDWKVTLYNQKFLDLWRVSADQIDRLDDRLLVQLMQFQLLEAEAFRQQVQDEYNYPILSNQSLWTFTDGLVVERYSQSQLLEHRSIGRVVSYRDVTTRQQAETALREEARRQAIVLELQKEIATTQLQLDEIMALIVHQTQQITNASGAVLELIEGDELVCRAASGTTIKHLGSRLHRSRSLSGHCLSLGKVLYCQDSESGSQADRSACRIMGARSMIVVPLLHQRVDIGVLKVFSATPSAFTHQDVQTLQFMATFLATQISIALEFAARQAALTALQESEERYRSVVTVLSEGIVMQNAQGVICASNASAERILGLSIEQMMGRTSIDPRWRAIHEDGSAFPGQAHPAMLTLQTGKPCYGVVMGIHKPNGELTWILINSQPLFHPGEALPYAAVASFTDITQRKQAEQDLFQREQEFRALVENSPDIIARLDRDLRHCYINPAVEVKTGISPAAHIGKTPTEIGNAESLSTLWQAVQQAFETQQPQAIEFELPAPTHLSTYYDTRIVPEFNKHGAVETVLVMTRDITPLKQTEQALFHEKELAQVTLQSIGDAVITTDASGNIKYLNPVAEALMGWEKSEVQGLPLTEIFRIVHAITRQSVENPIEQALLQDRIVGLDSHTVLINRNGQEVAIEDSAAPIHNHQGEIVGAVMVFHDVTQTRVLSQQLVWHASHDALTGLVNRREFEHQLAQALEHVELHHQQHALCYLDLDQFKIVNDTCGHAAGDELLRQVTVLLQAQIRKTDTLARLGGDEFGVLLHQCPLDQALKVANVLRECLQGFRFVYQNQTFVIGVSIGLVAVTAASGSLSSLLSAADAACYTAKNKGRNRVHLFQPDDADLLQQRGEMQWVPRLTQALEENRFCLHYQPIATILETGLQIDHYEVLLRLRDQDDKLILPMAFIPAAERYNLMHRIDRWVIHTLFSQWSMVTRQGEGIYAINLSGASLNDEEFIGFLYEEFAAYPVPPQSICFEITETSAIANLIKTNQLIRELQQLGCQFALDDFGIGMSSFGYLKNLSVDYLKIDGGFIKNIVANPVDAAMVEAITHIGHVMGIKTIAEFVEDAAILNCIRAMGVDYAQGYGIAPPLPYAGNSVSCKDDSCTQSMS